MFGEIHIGGFRAGGAGWHVCVCGHASEKK